MNSPIQSLYALRHQLASSTERPFQVPIKLFRIDLAVGNYCQLENNHELPIIADLIVII